MKYEKTSQNGTFAGMFTSQPVAGRASPEIPNDVLWKVRLMMTMTTKMYGLPALRVALLAGCTILAGSAPMLAQDTAPASQDAPPPPHGEGRGGPGMQERQLEHMTKDLNLTPDQVTSIKAIQADNRTQMMALRDDTSTAGPDKRAKMMAMRDAEQTKIKAVLTDDQKTKYDAMMAKMRERREQHGDGGPPPPPPGSN